MPEWLRQKLAEYKRHAGVSFLNSQLLLLAIAFAIAAIQWVLLGHASLVSTLIYTFFAGNAVTIILSLCGPLFDQPFPRDWIVYTALLLPVSVIAGTIGGVRIASPLTARSPPLRIGGAETSHTRLSSASSLAL